MNQYLPYEEVITKKMDELPLPDRQAAIWQAIQVQIGTSLPDVPDDGISMSQKVTVSSKKVIIGVIITGIIIAVTLMVASRKKKAPQNKKAIPEIIHPQTLVNDSPLQEEQKKTATLPIKADTASTILRQINIDTSTIINPVFPAIFKPDTNKLQGPVITPKDTIAKPPVILPNKKNIGVQGISDSSYRISGKKDSL